MNYQAALLFLAFASGIIGFFALVITGAMYERPKTGIIITSVSLAVCIISGFVAALLS